MKTPILRSTLLAAILAAFAGGSYAAGLGRISVFSALGQPLRAEVEIAATPDELDGMSARIAAPDAFKRANIEYDSSLSGLRMTIERRAATNAVVKISSDKPFSEPFVDMLIELNWSSGRLLREYTFLLDPAEMAEQKTPASVNQPIARPDVSVKPSATAAAPESSRLPAPPVAPSKPTAKAKIVEATKPVQVAAGEYEVKKGDTLTSISDSLKSSDVSTQQMLAALYRANDDAFVNGNINRLRAGKILKVPEAEAVQRISKSEARQIVLKASNFEGYRKSVASAAAAAPAQQTAASQSSEGKIVPKVAESAPAAAASGQLKISQSKNGKTAGAEGSVARLQALQEDLASRNKALQEANSRVAELEKNVKELQRLVDLKSQNLSDLQKQAAADKQANQKALKDAQDAKVAAAKQAEEAKAAAAKQAEEAKQQAAEAKAAADKAAADKAAEEAKAATQAAEVASAPAVEAQPVPTPSVEVQSAPAPEPAIVEKTAPPPAAPAPVEEEGGVLSNPLALGGLLLAALGAGYVFMRNRKRNPKNTGLTMSSLSEASTSPNSVFGNAGGQTVDTGTSVLHTDFSQSGLSAIDTDEGVDPVAEADVYMAYGRDAQAEEILLDALKNDPSRSAIYVKLLEIYAQRRSVKQFENIATDLYTQTGGAGDDWAKAAALGARLDPTNPLYRTGAGTDSAPAPVEAVSAVPVIEAAISAAAVAAAVPQHIEPEPVPEEPAPAPAVTFGTNNVSQMRATWTVPGEIGQFDATTGEIPQVPEIPETGVTTTGTDPLNLDFNLDLELPEGEEPETQMEPRSEPMELEFGGIEDLPVVAETAPAPEAQAPKATDSMNPLEFDIDFGADTQPDVAAVAPAPAAAADIGARPIDHIGEGEVDDVDLGIERAMEKTTLAVVDLEKTNFEGSLLDFDFELGDDSRPDDRSLDLSAMNLRTDGNLSSTAGIAPAATARAEAVAPAAAPVAAAPEAALADEPLGNIDINDEVSTKLELARAYEEMGDLEGARELLEEVMTDGGEPQKEMARTILTRIS